ncbi:MAG: PaaI family thioesterase [Variovorax sp.]|nr:MAG: PaaI family thioesterase [Variovorax sp.]
MSEHAFPLALLNLLGFVRMLEPEGDRVRLTFEGREEHTHSNGAIVQGGILTAWLDHAMARAVIARDPASSVASLEIKTTFMSAVGPGVHIVSARAAKWGRQVVFLEAEIRDDSGRVRVSASSCGLRVPAG